MPGAFIIYNIMKWREIPNTINSLKTYMYGWFPKIPMHIPSKEKDDRVLKMYYDYIGDSTIASCVKGVSEKQHKQDCKKGNLNRGLVLPKGYENCGVYKQKKIYHYNDWDENILYFTPYTELYIKGEDLRTLNIFNNNVSIEWDLNSAYYLKSTRIDLTKYKHFNIDE